ncbi:putative permease [Stieleria bergensis]|uniref:Putative permease n=1 Tax=Stieleria bergensis TaxID=2528025 RepID=A0A517SYX8_9BACT|nr:putative permease [Planctomycetes bacterium SV_7m_r]
MTDAALESVFSLLRSGAGNLAAYLAAHVLLCLLPAFLVAGAMTALIPKEIITRFLGRDCPKAISYPAAAAGGFLLAVCSCTVIPLFAGIYKKGAGLGPAIAFLFVAPAVNILALVYTGKMLGVDLAIARGVLSVVFGVGIGLLMALIFRGDDVEHDQATTRMFSGQGSMRGSTVSLLSLLVALLIVGTLQLDMLMHAYAQVQIPTTSIHHFQDFLAELVPHDTSKGEEGVTAQGAILIGLLVLIGLAAWRGIECIFERFSAWTWVFVSLVGVTLMFASLQIVPTSKGVTLHFTGKFIGVSIITAALGWVLKTRLASDELRDFLWESWRFVKQIFPLLIIGVFIVGVIRELVQPQWVQSLAGENTVGGNFVGVVFGVFMYFPTLVEVPIAQMFLDLGMHRGPLLAYLLADPELSFQSILITASVIGKKKAWVYVGLVAVFSTLAGMLYGTWIDGSSLWSVTSYLLAVLGGIVAILWVVGRRQVRHSKPNTTSS